MLSLVAALACVIAPSSSPVGDMSLPVEPALSSPLVLQSLPQAAQPSDATPEMLTPLVIECAPGDRHRASSVVADCSGLSSRADDGGSCVLLAPSRGRLAVLARGHAHESTRHVGAGAIVPAPDLLTPDAHDAPPLSPARFALTPPHATAQLFPHAAATPPAAPHSRIDRPPRA